MGSFGKEKKKPPRSADNARHGTVVGVRAGGRG